MSDSPASVLAEPFEAYLDRRARSNLPFAPGEAVTAAVALLRGCRRATGTFVGTRWWLRADGCPIVREEGDGPDAVAATADVLERVAANASDDSTRGILARARESVLTLPPREWESLERRLFQHADPLPLILGPLTPVGGEPPPPPAPETVAPVSRVLALVDADLALTVQEALRDLRERWRTSPAVRLGMTGAAAALIIVAAVLLWPQPNHERASDPGGLPAGVIRVAAPTAGPSTASVPTTTPSIPVQGEAEEDASTAPSRSSAPAPSDDPVEIARTLFADVDRCADDVACVTSFTDISADLREPLPAGAAEADIELIDDFGGVFVVRLTVESTAHYVTIVRQKDRWLVRAVGGADQPS
ncbi:hypothetical protein QE410_001516 [Microbacterium sp. SORGH_AS 1204]|uniref:hypothetical protein n=1 Tax=Microbacterium sp. SORGH_AS_1204 TaxID=3041785 RepID=UPI00278E9FD7|nr:hypothetical protein [Microbacterium sp. SORGH_AS_1204]MDQ1136717.1 hypothetical protein [Microbacterium sp. SORGH_AS_1204]